MTANSRIGGYSIRKLDDGSLEAKYELTAMTAEIDKADRSFALTWRADEWHFDCGCALHPTDDNGTHGGGPHIQPCAKHEFLSNSAERLRAWQ